MRGHLAPLLLLLSLSPSVVIARDSVEISSRSGRESDLVITVWCRDGAFYRGEPIEYVPNDHLTLRLVDGKSLRIGWDNVSSVDGMPSKAASPKVEEPARRAYSPTPPARTAPVAPMPSVDEPTFDAVSPTPPRRKMRLGAPGEVVVSMPLLPGNTPVQVRFTGMHEGAMIEYLASSAEINGWSWPSGFVNATADTWKQICALPCRLNADRDKTLRISGPNITDSTPFLLPTRGDRFEVEIKPGWDTTRTAAWAVMGVGIAIGTIGAAVLASGTTIETDPLRTNLMIGGLSLLGAGAVTTLISIPVFAKSRTDIEVYRE